MRASMPEFVCSRSDATVLA